MQGDIWAITPSTSATLLMEAASIADAGALTLLVNEIAPNGTGYRLLFTSAADDTGITFTIRGLRVGDLTGSTITEVVAGVDNTTTESLNYYAYVESITASGASAGDVSIGTGGYLALPRTRLKGLYYVGAETVGSIQLNLNGESGATLLRVDSPAGSEASAFSLYVPPQGLLTTRSGISDFSVLVLDQVSAVTVFCG